MPRRSASLLTAPYFRDAIDDARDAWRRGVTTAARLGIPTPASTPYRPTADTLAADDLAAAEGADPAGAAVGSCYVEAQLRHLEREH
ncbi:hypothetical protein [Streptantibioticus silvisoli]|uniref:Uncharacterized protein n=1 Tax=Streptantibioticus silvisoli TaxID=2705255 RepID=A0ABT6VY05_9ACTN|nr:hypothetical protein [Streptantibioticus silvisoli]MDI5963372.1 hypothetical protein [Streptantibioticus silvisoli]